MGLAFTGLNSISLRSVMQYGNEPRSVKEKDLIRLKGNDAPKR